MNSHLTAKPSLKLLCLATKAKADDRRCDDAVSRSADGRFAVADGTTSCGVASGYFAQFLADQFAIHSGLAEVDLAMASEDALEKWLRGLAVEWQRFLTGLFGAYSLAWSARAWAEGEPTGCTFAGIRVVDTNAHYASMNVVVVGDSAVYCIQDSGLQRFRQKEDVSPGLIGVTNGIQLRQTGESKMLARSPLLCRNVHLAPGSFLVLASDAVADWIETQCAESSPPIEALRTFLSLRSQTDFERWLCEVRRDAAYGQKPDLAKDDKAIMILQVPSE